MSARFEQGVADDLDPERAWAVVVGALTLGLVGGSVLFPRQVYVNFVWEYFWGPVYADAHGAQCVEWAGGARRLHDAAGCRAATEPVAYIGYTAVSEVGYVVVLLLALVGVIFLLRRLDVGAERSLLVTLLPFVFFGGALRVVEDANDRVPQGVEAAITYPWNALLISPIIYVTVFAVTLLALLASVWLARTGRADDYLAPLFWLGTAVLAVTVGYLGYLSATTQYVAFHPVIAVLTLGIASLATAATWWVVDAYWPTVNEATGRLGVVVIWAHAIDGTANVLGIDWGRELGLPVDMQPKHPVNQAVIDVTTNVLPASVTDVIGATWPFLLVKLAAAVIAVWLFNDEVFEESPRYAVLLLVAIVAVGLGPGTRDMLRATFGI